MSLVKKIDHLAIAVNDVDAAVETFARHFAFPVERRGEVARLGIKRAHLRIGDATLELFSPTGEPHPAAKFLAARGEGMYLLSLEVDDLAAAVAALDAKGVPARLEELEDGTKLGFLGPKGTHGVLIQFIQHPGA